jgi:D-glycero-D-manno-heptose 1,7-bisphosphate phosphatase
MKIIILDRDGVINYDSAKYIKKVDEWEPIEDSLEAIANLTSLDYKIIICSNQSGIGRGLFTMEDLNEMHEKMHKLVHLAGGEIAAIFICPHTPDDNCNCRKPKPGMIYEICERFNVEDITQVMMVGDSQRDLEAIHSASGIPVLVKTGNGKKTKSLDKLPPGTLIFDSLLAFSEYLIDKDNQENHEI